MNMLEEFATRCMDTFSCTNEYYIIAIGLIVIGIVTAKLSWKLVTKEMEEQD